MAETRKTQTRQASARQQNIYDLRLKNSDELMEQGRKGKKLIKSKDIPWEQGRHGILKWYSTQEISGLALNTMKLFVNEVRTHGGKHIHGGGVNIFVLEGKGYTVVDGVRYDWQKGDLIMLPIKAGGVEHQHFNLEDKPSRWVALISMPLEQLLGDFMKQTETHPDWKGELNPQSEG